MAGEGDIDRIVQERFFKGQTSGVFVDVGAAHPEYLSISRRFREAGWKIVAIEPNPKFCGLYRAMGYDVDQYACGNRDEDGVLFQIVNSHGQPYAGGNVTYESFSSLGLRGSYVASFLDVPKADVETIRVSLRRLDTILKEKHPDVQKIDILSIDVEGYEREVLAGLSVSKYQPSVIIIENLFDDPFYGACMVSLGYRLWRKIPPNEIYERPLVG